MRNFIDIITESLAEPYPLVWDTRRDDLWHATFMAGDEEYSVSIDRTRGFPHPNDPSNDDVWYDLAFGLTNDYFAGAKVIGTDGKAFRIFATALEGYREFLTTVKPEFFMLSASKDNQNRYRLYKRMAKRFEQELSAMGYVPTTPPEHKHVKTAKYFDSLAWRRISINEGVNEHSSVSILSDHDLQDLFYEGPNEGRNSEFRYLYLGQRETHVVALAGDLITGIASLQQDPYNQSNLWFKHVSIPEQFSGKGVATSIIKRCFEYADLHGKTLEPSSFTEQGQNLKPVFSRLYALFPATNPHKPFRDF